MQQLVHFRGTGPAEFAANSCGPSTAKMVPISRFTHPWQSGISAEANKWPGDRAEDNEGTHGGTPVATGEWEGSDIPCETPFSPNMGAYVKRQDEVFPRRIAYSFSSSLSPLTGGVIWPPSLTPTSMSGRRTSCPTRWPPGSMRPISGCPLSLPTITRRLPVSPYL